MAQATARHNRIQEDRDLGPAPATRATAEVEAMAHRVPVERQPAVQGLLEQVAPRTIRRALMVLVQAETVGEGLPALCRLREASVVLASSSAA